MPEEQAERVPCYQPDVLIINPYSENLQVLEKVLDENAVEFRVADSPGRALAAAANDRPDLILLDVRNSGGNGFEICQKLKSGSETGQIPVIFLVEGSRPDMIRHGFELGCDDWLSKPFRRDELAARLRLHLDLCRSRQTIVRQKREIGEMRNELDTALKSRDRRLSLIAHDLKDPVASLVGFSGLLLNDSTGYKKEELKEIFAQINKTAIHSLNLLNNLLEWTRSRTGITNYKPEWFSFVQLVDEIRELYGTSAEMKSIELITRRDPVYEICADRRLIHTVVRNLVSNALKFTGRGGKIRIGCRDLRDEYEISVTDSGVGIPAGDMDSLFSVSAYHSTQGTDDEKGTGLGLILCKEIIENCGGRIHATSKPGKGSVFSFTIPKKI
jgi:two-component system sensor histidine kinase/response regulator